MNISPTVGLFPYQYMFPKGNVRICLCVLSVSRSHHTVQLFCVYHMLIIFIHVSFGRRFHIVIIIINCDRALSLLLWGGQRRSLHSRSLGTRMRKTNHGNYLYINHWERGFAHMHAQHPFATSGSIHKVSIVEQMCTMRTRCQTLVTSMKSARTLYIYQLYTRTPINQHTRRHPRIP